MLYIRTNVITKKELSLTFYQSLCKKCLALCYVYNQLIIFYLPECYYSSFCYIYK